jgi:hypothetical protein
MGPSVEAEFHISGFVVHSVVLPFGLHGELNALMDAI